MKLAGEGKAADVKDQVTSLRMTIGSPQTQVAPSRKTSKNLPRKRRKYVPVKEEPPSSDEVMAIRGVALERLEPVEVPLDILLDDARQERTLKC